MILGTHAAHTGISSSLNWKTAPGIIRDLLHAVTPPGTRPSPPTSGQLLTRCNPLTFHVSPWGCTYVPSRTAFTGLGCGTPVGMPLIHP